MTIVLAPAKLTISLRITGVRDDGYHLLDAEMVTVDLCDALTFDDGDGLTIDGPAFEPPTFGAADLDAPPVSATDAQAAEVPTVPVGEDNLVRRALLLAGRRAHVRLHKRIPPGAGLGGGSADAAAVLRWAGFDDLEAAARLGADVPFCVRGGRARVTGIGERIEPLPYFDRTFTLATPPFGVDTAAVYAAWDDLGGPQGPGVNDLELAALRVEPRLDAWRQALGDATGATPVLAGSGSTWFVEGAHPAAGRIVVRTLDRSE